MRNTKAQKPSYNSSRDTQSKVTSILKFRNIARFSAPYIYGMADKTVMTIGCEAPNAIS